MPRFACISLACLCSCLAFDQTAYAYIDLAPTLARVIRESNVIAVVEVERFSLDKGAILLKKVSDLKGTAPAEPIKHQLRRADGAVDQAVLEWAEPGRRGVLFVSGNTSLVCLGRGWYQVHTGTEGWWQIGATRPDLPLAYYGNVSRLATAVTLMLADKTAIITTLPHNYDEQSDFDLPLNRASFPGLVKVQRVRANLAMPQLVMAMSGNPAYVIGQGTADPAEIPELIARLASADSTERAECAADLGSLGHQAVSAREPLLKLLDEPAIAPRMAAAAAILRIEGEHPRAVDALAAGLANENVTIRRTAARAAGLGGLGSAKLVKPLGLLLRDSDLITRGAALQAIATLGPIAAEVYEPVVSLLDQPETTIAAADALGRIGPAARPAVGKLTKLLSAETPAIRWAAVRAMAQIGGEEAKPAVEFMIRELKNPTVVDAYNMMIYLALLGPVAKDAIPAIQSCRQLMNPLLKPAAIWAIEPDKDLPWQTRPGGFGPFGLLGGPGPGGPGPGGPGGPPGGGPPGMGDVGGWIYESFVRELGDRLKPTAIKLAAKIMDGTAGDVPPWGYKILARFPDQTLPVFTAALADKELTTRERAAVALGYMGAAASSAKPQLLQAITSAPTEREKKLLQWCLRQFAVE